MANLAPKPTGTRSLVKPEPVKQEEPTDGHSNCLTPPKRMQSTVTDETVTARKGDKHVKEESLGVVPTLVCRQLYRLDYLNSLSLGTCGSMQRRASL